MFSAGPEPGGTTLKLESKKASWKSFSGLAKSVTLFEALIISFLTYWLYQESLANPYMAVYVNQVIQTEGATIGITLFITVLLVGVTGALALRGKKGTKAVDLTSIITKIPTPATLGTSAARPAPSTTSSTLSSAGTPKPASDLHPAVAALKAELSGTPTAFGAEPFSMTLPGREPAKPQPTTQANPHPANPMPATATTSRPSTVIVGAMPILKRADPPQAVRPPELPRSTSIPPPNTSPTHVSPGFFGSPTVQQPVPPFLKRVEPLNNPQSNTTTTQASHQITQVAEEKKPLPLLPVLKKAEDEKKAAQENKPGTTSQQ